MANTVYVKKLAIDYNGELILRASGNTTDDADGNWKYKINDSGNLCLYYYKTDQWVLREEWEKII